MVVFEGIPFSVELCHYTRTFKIIRRKMKNKRKILVACSYTLYALLLDFFSFHLFSLSLIFGSMDVFNVCQVLNANTHYVYTNMFVTLSMR